MNVAVTAVVGRHLDASPISSLVSTTCPMSTPPSRMFCGCGPEHVAERSGSVLTDDNAGCVQMLGNVPQEVGVHERVVVEERHPAIVDLREHVVLEFVPSEVLPSRVEADVPAQFPRLTQRSEDAVGEHGKILGARTRRQDVEPYHTPLAPTTRCSTDQSVSRATRRHGGRCTGWPHESSSSPCPGLPS